MAKVYRTDIRFDTKAQKDRLALAAKQRHWSLNRFMLVATEAYLSMMTCGEFSPVGHEQITISRGKDAQEEAGAL